jgi:hypothetical protein
MKGRGSLRGSLFLLCPFLLTLAITHTAHAQLSEIRVQPGDTCRTIAIRVFGDASGVATLHEHNPELGPTPHHLVPGSILRVPRPSPPAELTAIVRRVERRAPDAAAFAAAQIGQELPRGTQVRTHDASSAEITFSDRAEVTVRERTLVIVYGGRQRVVERAITRAELERGALRSRLGELAGQRPLEVETPSSRASLDGDAVVSVEEDGTSRVANHGRRTATVVAGGARVRLPGGTGTVVRRGEAPIAPRSLLDAPRWRADHVGPVLGFVGAGATLSGGFDRVEGAARYRVEIARRPDGGDLLSALEIDGASGRFEATGIGEGTVYVSLATIDAAGLEGRRSPWRAFSIRLARLLAPGGSELTITGAPRVLPGTWLVAPRGLACGASGEGIVTLRDPGRNAIVCRDNAGTELAPLIVDVAAPHVVMQSTLVRDRSTVIDIELHGELLPTPELLALDVPPGYRAGRVEGEDGSLHVEVHAPIDAPDRAEIALSIVSGAERIPIASVALPVRDPEGASSTEPVEVAIAPPIVQGALGDLAWPSALSLRDYRRGGIGAWIYAAPIATPDLADPQLRVGVGARAQLPDVPIRLGFASQLDTLARPASRDRRGDADLIGSLGALLIEGPSGALAIDMSAWFPTRTEAEGSLGRVRLTPSLEGSARPIDWLVLRTRQGAIIDASEAGARLWAWAIGIDLSLEWLAIGLELDAAIGQLTDDIGAALALGGGIEARLDIFELALGARFALTPEGRTIYGDATGVLTVRLFSR